ncbi:MAG TPA: lipid A deacylase LpxR family protein [Verrucomicrobiae bacterium]|nr:lipid A deacylase LpxR family protein [Verrucomicrobiae bacterium]
MRGSSRRKTFRCRHPGPVAAAAALALLAAAIAPAAAADEPAKDFRQKYLFRFEFDNDTFLGSDDAFTAGWSFQLHSPLDDAWGPAYAKWIGRFPGLGDDGTGGRIVRWAVGLNQIILTPEDITIETPQPDDIPWAGVLDVTVSWSAYDNKKMAALQAFVGCMGPCSGAESVQKFVHEDLGFGQTPEGWDNQLVNQVLGNLNYEYRYKVVADHTDQYFNPGHFGHDLSVGGQAAVGNFATYVWGEFEYRLGWGLPMGFTKTPDPPGFGMMLDPVYVPAVGPLPGIPAAWRNYFTLMGRVAYFTYLAPAEGGETVAGDIHPKLRPYPGRYQALIGYHLARIPFAFHLTYYRYFNQDSDGASSSDWVNLSFEYRF